MNVRCPRCGRRVFDLIEVEGEAAIAIKCPLCGLVTIYRLGEIAEGMELND